MPHQLTNFSPGRIFDFNWSWDGKRLLLVHGESAAMWSSSTSPLRAMLPGVRVVSLRARWAAITTSAGSASSHCGSVSNPRELTQLGSEQLLRFLFS